MGADIVDDLEALAEKVSGRQMLVATTLRRAAAEIGGLRGEVERQESSHGNTIDQRDRAHEMIDSVYAAVMDAFPEWSSAYGFADALNDIEDRIHTIRTATPAPAMPNGVEAADVHLAAEMLTWGREEGLTVKQEAEVAAHAEKLFRLLRAADNRDAAGVDTLVAKDVQRVMADGDGFWAPCSGCYETEDGHPVGEYPYSSIFQCALGGGCRECGGLGAVWDSTDYAAMAEAVLSAEDTPAAVPAGEAVAVCGTCNGVGMIGGHRGQTPDSFEQWAEDCPDCTPQPADGEAVGTVMVVPSDDSAPVQIGWHRDIPPVGTKLYTTPPAPVQAAPQEGEAGIDYDEHPFACPFYRGNPCECGQDQHIRFADKGRQDAAIAAAMTAALQHRGDSRGGEGL